MTKQEFFNLPTNKETIEMLFNESLKRFRSDDPEIIATNWFFNEVAVAIRTYVYLPKSVKKITTMPTTESIYANYLKIKEYGYRKELKMPF
jgi:hypothetical protein